MADLFDMRLWLNRAVFVALAFTIMTVQLIPLDLRPARWAGPDVLLVATLVWVVRKPVFLPVGMIAAVFLVADLVLLRPPGLWAVLVIALTEMIRRRHDDLRNMPFLGEWAMIAVGIMAITVANRLVLAVVLVPLDPLGLVLLQMVATIATYPFVIMVGYYIFGIRRAALGEMDRKGQMS